MVAGHEQAVLFDQIADMVADMTRCQQRAYRKFVGAEHIVLRELTGAAEGLILKTVIGDDIADQRSASALGEHAGRR